MRPFYLSGEVGQRFCLYHPAQGEERGAIIYLHPFAEEMNKSRRMAALQSKALAAAGYSVLQIDLLGCGDSSGESSVATWDAWRADVMLAYRWLRGQTQAPLILWGLRAGCLLAVDVAAELPEAADFIFWQPVVSGKQHWQQFMRLKMAGELASGQAKAVGEQLREQLAGRQPVEIAGYGIRHELVNGLEMAELKPPLVRGGRVLWLEISSRDDATLSLPSMKRVEQWLAANWVVTARIVSGPAFWQTTEIEDAPALISATLAGLELAA